MSLSVSLSSLFDKLVDRSRESFPEFTSGKPSFVRPYYWLEGKLGPFKLGADLALIAGHMTTLTPLRVMPDGELVPTASITLMHPLDSRPSYYAPFHIQIVVRELPAVPLVYVISPRIDARTFPRHPHLVHITHPSGVPQQAGCIFQPSTGLWTWDDPAPEKLIASTAIWLGAHAIWAETGNWLIPSAGHDPKLLAKLTDPDDQCYCYSGLPARKCHLKPAQG